MALAYGELTRFHSGHHPFDDYRFSRQQAGRFFWAERSGRPMAKPSTKPFRLVATIQTFLAVLFLLEDIAVSIR
ncbi:hypothetical protein AB4094_03505 [Acidithiobacillus ferrianus]